MSRTTMDMAMIRLYCKGKKHRETENGTDAGSESRSKIYFDYAEQQGGKDREAGLKRKTENYRKSPNCPSSQSCPSNPSNPIIPSSPTTPTTPISPIPANRSSAHPLTAPRSPLPVPPLCPQCQALLDYAHKRLEHCKFGENKPSCTRCPVHCYKPAMREQIRQVMRYSGPRMLLHDPVMAIRHLWDFLRAKFS